MKSIQSKILLLIMMCVLLASGFNSIAGLYTTSHMLKDETDKIMNLLCEQNVERINSQLLSIEQSVDSLSLRALRQIDNVDRLWTDSSYMDSVTESMEQAALSHAENNDNVMTVYLAYNPEFTSPTAGFFWGRDSKEEDFQVLPRTDLNAYEKDDMEYVGWYYMPVDNGGATWMMPYHNENTDGWIISYVVPLYKDDVLIGVIGMDVSFKSIENVARDISFYDSGFGFITWDDGTILYHPQYEYMDKMNDIDSSGAKSLIEDMEKKEGSTEALHYEVNGQQKVFMFKKLRNDMCFCISVPVEEINRERDDLLRSNLFITCAVICFALIVAGILCRHLIKPLKILNSATQNVTVGQWNVKLDKTTNDEIGELTESFQTMLQYLNEYTDMINSLAYVDPMTGIKNKTAYSQVEKKLEESIRDGSANFAVAVFDVNNLKLANDTYGHLIGDTLICAVCKHICNVFRSSLVYRVGGDEFVAILEAEDLREYEERIETFLKGMDDIKLEEHPYISVSAACGVAIYDSETDTNYTDVFQRADDKMYQHKQSMKTKWR